jgi:hypothetical protein
MVESPSLLLVTFLDIAVPTEDLPVIGSTRASFGFGNHMIDMRFVLGRRDTLLMLLSWNRLDTTLLVLSSSFALLASRESR